MKLLFFLFLFNLNVIYSQTEKVWRIKLLNPSVELELPTGKYSAFSSALGVGFGGAYPNITSTLKGGFQYSINPFLDIQQKWFYNINKRINNNNYIYNNSANYVSLRLLIRGETISSNFIRTTDYDFAFGPTWGLQRSVSSKYHFLFDLGPIYYFDTNGEGDFFPLMLQLNIGFDL